MVADVVARRRRIARRARWAGRIALAGLVFVLTIAMTPTRGTVVVATDAADVPVVQLVEDQQSTVPSSTVPSSTVPSSTEAPGTDVAGKVVERAPAKVLADLGEMPRTGNRDDRLIAGAGWLLLGIGLLLVDAASALVRRRTRA